MMPVGYAMAYQVVHRHRLGLGLFVAGVVSLITLRYAFGAVTGALIGASMWLVLGLLYVIAIFTQPEADITAPGSGYPNHLFVLPVRTKELVLWPMLLGGVTLALGWMAVAALVLNKEPAVVPIFWPASMLAALLASLQALFWSPVRVGILRVVLAFVFIAVLVTVGAANPLGLAESSLSLVYLGVIAVSFAAAVHGVGRARRTQDSVRTVPERVHDQPLRAPFRSAQTAQLWYEWRRGGMALPIIALCCCVAASVPLFFCDTHGSIDGRSSVSANVYLSVYMPVLIRTIPIMAWILGGAVRIAGARSGSLYLPAFVAMRPLSSLQMALARLASRVLSGALALGILTVFLVGWLSLNGEILNVDSQPIDHGPLILLIWARSTSHEFWMAGVFTALVAAVVIRNLLVGQFASLSGKPVIAYSYMALVYAGPLMAVCLLSAAGIKAYTFLEPMVWGGVLLKAITSVATMRALVRQQILTLTGAVMALGLWCSVATAAFSAVVVLCGNDGTVARLLGFSELGTPDKSMILGLVILWTPLARIAAAPLMLEWNRRNPSKG